MNGEEQQLTKKQRKELRRQERRDEEARQRKNAGMKKLFILIGVIVVIGLVGWWLVSLGGNTELLAVDEDPYKGNADAAVVLTEYSDFQCPACASAASLLSLAEEAYGDQIKVVFNNFPLTSIHDNADEAAQAGECAYEQDTFWEYHDLLFERQNSWSNLGSPKDIFVSYAKELELDEALFTACYDGTDAKDRVDYDKREGNALGVNSTPSFFVNDKIVRNVGSLADLQKAIDEALGAIEESTTDGTIEIETEQPPTDEPVNESMENPIEEPTEE